MLRNYIKTAFRSLIKHKVISLINIFGLATGFTCCILLVIFIQHELSYDKFHTRYHETYRANLKYSIGESEAGGITSASALLPSLLREVPEVKTGVRVFNSGSFWPLVVKHNDRIFQESRFFYADSTFFEVFDFQLIKGHPEQALIRPNSVILTQSTALKYFGNADPMGKTIRVDNQSDYLVTGVMLDIPVNSHLQFDFLGSFSSLKASKNETWGSANFYTYVVLGNRDDYAALQDKSNLITKRISEATASGGDDYIRYDYTALADIHLKSDLKEDIPGGNIKYVYIFSIIALLILAIACVNYMNLTTARSVDRAREAGLRKVFGAYKTNLFFQFMSEALLITLTAGLLSLVFVKLLMPFYNELTGRVLSFELLQNPTLLTGFIITVMLTGFISGCYPSLVISSFRAAEVLKGSFKRSKSGVWLRKTLVVFQFGISTFLIISTLIIYKQLGFIQNKNLGYDREQVMVMSLDSEVRKDLNVFRQSILSNPRITNVAQAGESPVVIDGGYSIAIEGINEGERINVSAMSIDHEFIKTMNVTILAGEDITEADVAKVTRENQLTVQRSFVLNESCVKFMNFTNREIIGRKVNMNGRIGTVKAVVKDFHFASLHQKVGPLVLFIEPWNYNYALVKITPENISGTIAYMKEKWEALFRHRPFGFEFMEAEFNQLYLAEQQAGKVFLAFATIAILLACLGLFGLASFVARQKIKEIGIRKTMGASSLNILKLLNKDFVRLVVVAISITIPVTYLFIDNWLAGFSYKTSIGAGVFIVAAIISLVIALGTVSFQTIKAASTNPADLLRNE